MKKDTAEAMSQVKIFELFIGCPSCLNNNSPQGRLCGKIQL